MSSSYPRRQRVAAYAVILRDGKVLLSRLASHISAEPLWTLPGGGLDHGEDPRDAVVREVREETGLAVETSAEARVYSAHLPGAWRDGRRVDAHALRIVYEGWVPVDAPEPQVLEVGGSTAEAAWHDLADVRSGAVPVSAMVVEALADHRPHRLQRLAAYALLRRTSADGAPEVLLTRISRRGHHRGAWTLPGGGVEHGEAPADALVREVAEETGLAVEVGALLGVHDVHFTGTAPSGRLEDFHGVHLVFAAQVAGSGDTAAGAVGEPRVVETTGTTDAVAWVAEREVRAGGVPVLDVVTHALDLST